MNPEVEHILTLAGVDVSALTLTHECPHKYLRVVPTHVGMEYLYMGEYPVLVYDHGDAGIRIHAGRDIEHAMTPIYNSGIFA